jgi:hypothetical protein
MEDTPEVMTEPAVQAESRLSVPTAVLDATLEYLATKPYKEVYKLISAIQAEAKAI